MLEADHASREDLAKPRTPFAGLVLGNLEMIGRLRWCSLVNDLCSPTLQKVKGLHGFQHPPSYCMEYHAFLSHSLIHSLLKILLQTPHDDHRPEILQFRLTVIKVDLF